MFQQHELYDAMLHTQSLFAVETICQNM
jgi:hypothetical protein